MAAGGGVADQTQTVPSYIVVGFVGGFVNHEDTRHAVVRLAQRIRASAPNDVYVQVFENRHRKAACRTIHHLLDRSHDGALAGAEKAQARIILFGNSWGASAAVLLARDLNRARIPVLLTVQVDSVAKLWQNDAVIPENVSAAANFYQPHGFVHGRREITAANPSRTQIIGNYRFDYGIDSLRCDELPWADRHFTPGHAKSECDPRLWSEVESLVRSRLEPQPGAVAANPQR